MQFLTIADALVESGRLGQKTGAGYYRYDPDTRARYSDPQVSEVIRREASRHGVSQRVLTKEEIQDRHILSLVNEGFRILEEGIAQRPGDIDLVYVHGYGFPSYRGGPMFYASQRGLDSVFDRLEALAARSGELYWKPAPLLKRLVEQGQTLEEWMANRT